MSFLRLLPLACILSWGAAPPTPPSDGYATLTCAECNEIAKCCHRWSGPKGCQVSSGACIDYPKRIWMEPEELQWNINYSDYEYNALRKEMDDTKIDTVGTWHAPAGLAWFTQGCGATSGFFPVPDPKIRDKKLEGECHQGRLRMGRTITNCMSMNVMDCLPDNNAWLGTSFNYRLTRPVAPEAFFPNDKTFNDGLKYYNIRPMTRSVAGDVHLLIDLAITVSFSGTLDPENWYLKIFADLNGDGVLSSGGMMRNNADDRWVTKTERDALEDEVDTELLTGRDGLRLAEMKVLCNYHPGELCDMPMTCVPDPRTGFCTYTIVFSYQTTWNVMWNAYRRSKTHQHSQVTQTKGTRFIDVMGKLDQPVNFYLLGLQIIKTVPDMYNARFGPTLELPGLTMGVVWGEDEVYYLEVSSLPKWAGKLKRVRKTLDDALEHCEGFVHHGTCYGNSTCQTCNLLAFDPQLLADCCHATARYYYRKMMDEGAGNAFPDETGVLSPGCKWHHGFCSSRHGTFAFPNDLAESAFGIHTGTGIAWDVHAWKVLNLAQAIGSVSAHPHNAVIKDPGRNFGHHMWIHRGVAASSTTSCTFDYGLYQYITPFYGSERSMQFTYFKGWDDPFYGENCTEYPPP